MKILAIRPNDCAEVESFVEMLKNSYSIMETDEILKKYTEKIINRLNEISPIPQNKEDLEGVYTVYTTK